MGIDLAQIGIAVVALLSPYLAKAGEGFAQKAGEVAWDKVAALYQAIRRKFKTDKDKEALQALHRLEKQPTDGKHQAALAGILTEKAQTDPEFTQELVRLVQVTTQDETVARFLTQVYDKGQVDKIINIGQAGVVHID